MSNVFKDFLNSMKLTEDDEYDDYLDDTDEKEEKRARRLEKKEAKRMKHEEESESPIYASQQTAAASEIKKERVAKMEEVQLVRLYRFE